MRNPRLTDTQQLRMTEREECLRLRLSLEFPERIFCNLGTEKEPFYVRPIPKNCSSQDLKDMKSYESQMERHPDSYLSCTFHEHMNSHQESHGLTIIYHETGLQKILDEIGE